jgi:hypothetical protein
MAEPRPDESLREFLDRREHELMSSIASKKAELVAMELELVEVRRAKGSLGITDQRTANLIAESKRTAEQVEAQYSMYRDVGLRLKDVPVASLKIKDLIIRAFLDHFPDGASPAEIGECIQSAYRRKIDSGSIRPNLARLRKDVLIMQAAGTRWVCVPQAARAILHHYRGDGDDDGLFLAMAAAMAWRE